MYRIAPSLDLGFLVGTPLIQIALGKHDLQFVFDSGVTISVRSEADVLRDGAVVATWSAQAGWSSTAFAILLDRVPTRVWAPNDRMLELEFPDSVALRMHDNSDQFESINIWGGGHDVIAI